MPTPGIETPTELDVAIALRAEKNRDALWREARGNRIYRSDALYGVAVLALVAAAAVDAPHASGALALASLLALAGYATHTSRQLKAMCVLLELSKAATPSV
jgi:hypothetical protein